MDSSPAAELRLLTRLPSAAPLAKPAMMIPLAARAEATLAAVTVTPKPGMERAGTAMVMAPDTAGMTRGFGAGAEEAMTSRQARTN